jgi:hypothetical protein
VAGGFGPVRKAKAGLTDHPPVGAVSRRPGRLARGAARCGGLGRGCPVQDKSSSGSPGNATSPTRRGACSLDIHCLASGTRAVPGAIRPACRSRSVAGAAGRTCRCPKELTQITPGGDLRRRPASPEVSRLWREESRPWWRGGHQGWSDSTALRQASRWRLGRGRVGRCLRGGLTAVAREPGGSGRDGAGIGAVGRGGDP